MVVAFVYWLTARILSLDLFSDKGTMIQVLGYHDLKAWINGSKAMSQLTKWDFTLSKDKCTGSVEDLILDLKGLAKKWTFQEELSVGEDGKEYAHYQGRLSLQKKERLSGLRKLVSESLFETAHWSPTSNAGSKTGFDYVMKEQTRVDGPWMDTDAERPFIKDSVKEIITLYPWQQSVVEMSRLIDRRTVNIIYDTVGNNGKSTLVDYMKAYQMATKLPMTRDYKDIVQMACCIAIDKGRKDPSLKCWMVDMPRALDKKALGGFFSAIETLKGGDLFDMRYKFKEYTINEPIVWCFTNELPDTSLLSKDRWQIWTIDEGHLVNKTTELMEKQIVRVLTTPQGGCPLN